jgi:signal recognition particle receptor subunit beta
MVSINYSSREVCCKIVYYGPGLSGKTTNLQYVHAKVPSNTRGKLISLATEADRTLYFDFLPINIGSINGFSAKFQLYTVPGQVYYNATRKLVLRGVDGIVFVADSQPDKMDENIESLMNLEDNLAEYGYAVTDVPIVIQYNKRDLPNVMTVEQLQEQLNKRGWPYFEASATVGNGVFDTLKLIIKLVLDKAKNTSNTRFKANDAVGAGDSGRVAVAPNVSVDMVGSAQPARSSSGSGQIAISAADAYRPYPGSEAQVQAKPAAPVAAPRALDPEPVASQPAPVPYQDSYSYRKQEAEERTPSSDEQNRLHSPSMAPPLRRRQEAPKKRGFFKRLFGLK